METKLPLLEPEPESPTRSTAITTIRERAAAFEAAFPQWCGAWPIVRTEQGRQVLYAFWLLGNDYRNRTRFYGAYPPNFVKRVQALFPDVDEGDVLHVFSGSLPAGRYTRCDLRQEAELSCSVYDLTQTATRQYPLVIAGPPYSAEDAVQYQTPMVDRRRALQAIADVVPAGGFLAWLDTTWPMHSKKQWLTVGRISLVRSTNHRVRLLTIFERAGTR